LKKRHKGKYFAPNILREIDLSGSINDITRQENMLACIYAAPVMFISAILNFILQYVVWHENMIRVLMDTLLLCSFGIVLHVLLRINLKVKLFTFLTAGVFGMYFVFIYIRYQNNLGPLIWIIACLQLILVISHVKKDEAILNGIIILSVCIYTFIKAPDVTVLFNRFYYGMLLLLMFSFLLSVIAANHVHYSRYKIIKEQLKTVVKQKQEISALYKEVDEAKEELRMQNEKLQAYNIKIIQNEEALKHLAYYDMLTDLPNRTMIYESLDHILNTTQIQKTSIYVVFIDIDYFKNINDSLGHHVGDIFITEAAKRLKSSICEDDMLGRTGGDEFTLIINRNLTGKDVFKYLDTMRDKFSETFIIKNKVIQSSVSLGVSIFPVDGKDVITLMRKSDLAMYKAKELGKNTIQFYQQDIL